ncbi:MAG: M20/M25/M40 family metallo-hydrolase [Gemmatimonadaceae bacterium]|nr:M20/M25/M40 family metallo-hydrolase [Gemmatimonadaceae bacterium]
MQIDRPFLEATLAALVQINSVNPKFSDGSTDETMIAAHLDGVLRALGMEVTFHDAAPRRTSVVGRLRGTGGGRSLMLYGHTDTVGIEGMKAPLSGRTRDGKLHGRGSYDMKGGVAACIAAIKCIVDAGAPLAGDVIFVGAADEEVASIGMSNVLEHVRADAAIVTESTELQLCLAHKGFCWMEVEVEGRAAHGSRFEEGIDANMAMGRFLGRLDNLERDLRRRAPHALVGPPSLHAAVILGGTGTSTYAAHCRLEIERRTIPGETEASALAEIQSILDALAADDASFRARVRPLLSRGSFEADRNSTIVSIVESAATKVLGAPPKVIGEPYWMDAALMADAGIETVVIGPTGAGAHAAKEWVDLSSVESVAAILARAASSYCGGVG